MKHLQLFEEYASNGDGAIQRAEMVLEEIVAKAFPGQTYNTSSNNKAGDYTLDKDVDGDGTKYVFAEIYLTPDQFSEINAEIEEDYDAYVNKLQTVSSDDAEIFDVNTMPDDNAISISIAYEQGYGGRK